MCSGLKIREPLNGFLSVPLRGKCAVCKSKIHHPKSLVLNGAFGDNAGCGNKRRDLGNKGGPASPVAGWGERVWGDCNLASCSQAAGQGGAHSSPALPHASLLGLWTELPQTEGQIPALSLLPTGRTHYPRPRPL